MAHRQPAPLSGVDSRLLSAAGAGRLDLVRDALAAGASANAVDWCCDSALLLAARQGHIGCARALLQAGADPGWQGSRGETAAMVAVQLQSGGEELLQVVLACGGDVALSARSDAGLSVLQLACLRRRPAALARLLQRQREQLAAQAAAVAAAGAAAAASRAVPQPRPALQHPPEQPPAAAVPAPPLPARPAPDAGAVLVQAATVAAAPTEDAGLVADMARAEAAGYQRMLAETAAAGADERAVRRRQLCAPASRAASGGGGASLAALEAASQAAGRALVLASYAAVAAGEARCLELLVQEPLARVAYTTQFGGSRSDSSDATANSAADSAAASGGGSPRTRPPAQPPLLLRRRDEAEEERLQEELGFLLDADTVGPHNARAAAFLWQTSGLPCHLAAACNQAECLHLLLSSGFCPADERTADGFTPLMLAATADAGAAAAVLLRAGAALEARNSAGRTPLFLAAVSGSAEVLGVLLRAGADAGAAEQSRLYPPLTAAVARAATLAAAPTSQPCAPPFLRCVELLLAAGAAPDQPCKDGSTALHVAAEAGCQACADLLLRHGAALEAADASGRTPLARAAGAGRPQHADLILLLLERGAAVASSDLASRLLNCLLRPAAAGGAVVTVWHLLARLSAPQLQALSACPAFYELPHTDAPERPLPAAAVEAVLELASQGCSNLLYNVCPGDSASQGRRPAYLLELLRRAAAASAGGSWEAAAALRAAVAGSPHVAQLLVMWTSVQMCLQYAAVIARCRGVPHADREHLSARVGHLFSAYHSLGSLCAALHLSLTAGVAHPGVPLAETSDAALGPPPAPPTPAPRRESSPAPSGSDSVCSGGSSSSGDSSEPVAMDSEPPADGLSSSGSKQEEADAGGVSSGCGAADEAALAAPLLPGLPLSFAPPPEPAPAAAPAADPPAPSPSNPPAPGTALPALSPQAEPAIGAALLPYGAAIDELIACVADQAQLRAWHFALEYGEVASLPSKQVLLQSLIAAWPRRHESQLQLSSGRSRVLQRACSVVEGAAAEAGGGMGGALWHGLRVAFEEENASGDGVRREWFRLLASELTNPDTGLFESHDGGASFAPAPHASVQREHAGGPGGHLASFQLVGCMVGLAIMQGCTLPGFRLAPAAWRALLGQPAAPEEDLAAADPQLWRALCQLRGMGADVAALGLHFEQHDALGRAVELVPGGGRLRVTAGNAEQYVSALAHNKCVASLAAEAGAMSRGLRGVLTAGVVDTLARCFTHGELNALVAGLGSIDLADWREHVRYQNCGAGAEQVAWLWGALERWDQARRAALLAFVTGAASLPAGGFAALRGFNGAPHPFTVCLVAVEGDDRLPRASTCFNTLFLPRYSSAAVLEARLGQALSGNHVFDEAVIRQ